MPWHNAHGTAQKDFSGFWKANRSGPSEFQEIRADAMTEKAYFLGPVK